MTTLQVGATTITVPTTGTVWWRDEADWSPVLQGVVRPFGGGMVIQEGAAAGRPMTLAGGEPYASLSNAGLSALLALLSPAGVQVTVTLDDARSYTCTPARADGPPVRVRAMPTGGPDSPVLPIGSATQWWLDEIRLLIIAGPL